MFNSQKMGELLKVNLSENELDEKGRNLDEKGTLENQEFDEELDEKGRKKLTKREENSSQKGKSVTLEPASLKENKKKYIYKDENYIDIFTGEKLGVDGGITKYAGDLWSKVLAEMKNQVSVANYRTWLDKTVGFYYHGNDFIVGANNSIVEDYLNKNMLPLLEKTLIQLSSREFKICFLDIENDIG
jgi:hypothetical protein